MGHKARWISFWVTLVYWLGSAWGCANTANQEPIQVLLDEHPHEGQIAQDNTLEGTAQNAAPPPETRQPKAVHTSTTPPASDTTRSIRSLDRSKWPSMVVGPADGSTPHGLILFKDLPADLGISKGVQSHYAELDLEVVKLPADDFSRVNENATVSQSQILEALGDAQAQNWSAQNGSHLVLQPIKVSLDLLTAPFYQLSGSDGSDTDLDSPSPLTQFFTDLFHEEPQKIPADDPRNILNDTPNDTQKESIQADKPQAVSESTPADPPQDTVPQGEPAPAK